MTPEVLTDCLKSYIGLSETPCPCAGTTPDDNAGTSGYYITDMEGGIPVNFVGALADCNTGGIWDILREARKAGVKRFITDLSTQFAMSYKPRYPFYSGFIGMQESGTAISAETKRRAVLRLQSFKQPAAAKFKGFKVYSTVSDELEIEIYNSNDLTTPIGSVTSDTVAGQWTTFSFTDPVLVDLLNKGYHEGEIFYVTWVLPTGDYARRNRMYCCNGNAGKYPWRNFLDAGAFMVDSLSQMETNAARAYGSIGLGVMVDIEVGCTMGTWLCGLSFDLFNTDGINWQVAAAEKNAAVMAVCDHFIKHQNINHYTQYSKEVVYGLRAQSQKEYLSRVQHIVKNLPGEATQCFQCQDERLAVRSIMV